MRWHERKRQGISILPAKSKKTISLIFWIIIFDWDQQDDEEFFVEFLSHPSGKPIRDKKPANL
jgi:hypothetical protein